MAPEVRSGRPDRGLIDAGNGRVRTERARDLAFSSQVEGCVADDDAGILFVNEEDVGLWRLCAEPGGGDAMSAVDRRREGDQAYLGSFAVVADARSGIDGISETDGLDVSSANLGPGFEHGAMIAQDGRNVLP